MKKKLIPFILGLSMAAALPLAAHAAPIPVDGPEQDSRLVTYDGFVGVGGGVQAPNTDIVTAIPECILTIPKDTTILKGALKADIGNITVDGKYFVKPYYIQVHATKQDFIKVDSSTGELINNPSDNQKIVFNVDSEQNGSGTEAFITDNGSTQTYKCRNFWKDDTQASGSEDTDYLDGEVTNIAGREHIWIKIPANEWTTAEGGRYKGHVTFTAKFRDDFKASGTGATTEWADKTIS